MIKPRPSNERGFFDFGWLKTHHTFSFGDYVDRNFMGFSALRVINDDYIAQGKGFGTHGHQNMEIITYVISGELAHKDSMGNGSSILPGDVQYMSAGSGVTHSEFNNSKTDTTHLLQIWILPNVKGATPRYDQKQVSRESKKNNLKLIVSEKGEENSIAIRQDAKVYASVLECGSQLTHHYQPGRHGYVQLISGSLQLNKDVVLNAGDGAFISDESSLKIDSTSDETAEFLLFDLP